MSEPGDDFERALWSSARADAPPDASRERAFAAASLALKATGGSGAPPASGAPGAPTLAPFAATGAALVKWTVALATLVAVATSYVAVRASRGPTPDVATEAVTTPPAAPSLPTVPSRAAEPAPPYADVAASPVGVVAEPTARARRTPAARGDSLAAEIAALDGVRTALAARDPSRAIALLDGYDRAHAAGAFVPEARVLRVEALVARGDRAEATRLGRLLLAGAPDSPHAAHLRALLDAPPGSGVGD